MPNQSATQLTRVFHGLADPTRRAVLERLSSGPAPVSELARPFPMALPSFLQHMGVLENCGLVTSSKQGRVRTYQIAPLQLELAGSWLEQQRSHWNRRLDQLDAHLAQLKEK